MNKENMKQYRIYRPMEDLNTWWVVEWPDKLIATFTDSKTFTAEDAAKEYAEKMNAAYEKSNYDKCNESITAVWFAAQSLDYWSDVLFKKAHLNKYADSEPGYSVTGALTRMRESFKRVEEAINSMPSDEDVEKAVKEYRKSL